MLDTYLEGDRKSAGRWWDHVLWLVIFVLCRYCLCGCKLYLKF